MEARMPLKDWDSEYQPTAAPRGAGQQNQSMGANGSDTWNTLAQFGGHNSRRPAMETGGQWGSIENGWNTEFTKEAIRQREAAEKTKDPEKVRALPFAKDFTGIIDMDQVRGDQKRAYGDVYENGVRTGNLITGEGGYTKQQGEVVMAEWFLETTKKNKAYAEMVRDPEAISKALAEQRKASEKAFQAYTSQKAFQDRVDDTKEDWDPLVSGIASAAAGAAGGAMVGARFGGWGALGGALVGGIGGALNQDEVTDQAARALEKSRMAWEDDDNNVFGDIGSTIRAFGTTSMSASLSPLKNLYHGILDAGSIGDDISTYYEMEDKGGWKWLDVGVTLGDSVLQFMSPAGKVGYMASMGATAGGGAMELAGGGATFDDRRGEYHTPEDWAQGLSSAGNVGIDFLQLAMGANITRALTPELNAIAKNQKEAIGGYVFTRGADGALTGARTSWSVAVPSDMVTWMGVRAQAKIYQRRDLRQNITTRDMDSYLLEAARNLSGGKLAPSMFINASAEGAEEAVQAVLEPWSHGWNPSLNDVADAAMYGAAGGLGMSLGGRIGGSMDMRGREDDAMLYIANTRRLEAGLEPLDKKTFLKMTPEQREQKLSVTKADRDLAKQLSNMAESFTARKADLVPLYEMVQESVQKEQAKQLQNEHPGVETTHLVYQAVRDRAEVVELSGTLAWTDLQAHWEGIRLAATDPSISDEKRAVYNAIIAELDGTETTPGMVKAFESLFNVALDPEADPVARAQAIEDINRELMNLWNHDDYSKRVAVSLIYGRPPHDQSASHQMFVPQLHETDTMENLTGRRGFPWSAIEGWQQDFDGDKSRLRVFLQVIADPDMYDTLRIGRQLLGVSEGTPKIKERKSSIEIAGYMDREVSLAGGNTEKTVDEALKRIEDWILSLTAGWPGQKRIKSEIKSLLASYKSGQPALQKFMKFINQNYAAQLTKAAMEGTAVTNPRGRPLMELDSHVNRVLQDWKSNHSLRIPKQWQSSSSLTPIIPGSNPDAQRALGIGGATELVSMAFASGMADLFRAYQSFYFVDEKSGMLQRNTSPEAQHSRMAEFVIAVASGIDQTETDRVEAGDELHVQALAALKEIANIFQLQKDGPGAKAEGQYAHLLSIAAMPMPNMEFDAETAQYHDTGKDMTVAEFVLQSVAQRIQRRQDAAQLDTETIQRLNAVQRMSGNEAVIALLAPLGTHEALGRFESSTHSGSETLGQIVAEYESLGMQDRARYKELARSGTAAQGRIRHGIPHSLEDLHSGRTTSYNTFLEVMFAAVDQGLAYDPVANKLHGSEVKRDDAIIEDLENGLSLVSENIHRFAEMNNLPLTATSDQEQMDRLAEVLRRAPDYVTRGIAELVPEGQRVAHFTSPDGEIVMPDWMMKALLNTDPERAAMLVFRSLLLIEFSKHESSKVPGFTTQDEMVRIMLQAQQHPLHWRQFTEILEGSTSIKEFRLRINEAFESGPPRLAFLRDSGRHSLDLTKGGWDRSLPGTKMREALANFHTRAVQFQGYMKTRFERDEKDEAISLELTRVANGEAADVNDLRGKYDRMMKLASQLPRPMTAATMLLGPQAFADLMANLADKGKSTEGTEQMGPFLLKGNSPIASTAFGQLFGNLTAVDSHLVKGNLPSLTSQDRILMVDEFGRQFEFKIPSFEEFAAQWADPAMRPLLSAMVMPSAFDYSDEFGTMTQQFLGDGSLLSFFQGDSYEKLLFAKDDDSILQWTSMLEAKLSETPEGTFALQRWISEITQARFGKLDRPATDLEKQQIPIEAALEIGRVTRMFASGQGDAIREGMREALQDAARPDLFEDYEPDPKIRKVRKLAFIELVREFGEREGVTLNEEFLTKLEGGRTADYVLAATRIPWGNSAEAIQRQQELYNMAINRGFANLSPAIRDLLSITQIDPATELPVVSTSAERTQKVWDEVSLAIAGILMEQSYRAINPSFEIQPLTAESFKEFDNGLLGVASRSMKTDLRLYDSSYMYLLDPIMEDNAIANAARELGKLILPENSEVVIGLEDSFEAAVKDIIDPDKYGPMVPQLRHATSVAWRQIIAGATDVSIGISGEIFKRYAAPMEAAARTSMHPGADKARTYTLDGDMLERLIRGDLESGVPVDPTDPKSQLLPFMTAPALQNQSGRGAATASLQELDGRFATSVKVNYIDSAGNPAVIDLLGSDRYDDSLKGAPRAVISAGDMFYGPNIKDTYGLMTISTNKLSRSLESVHTILAKAQSVTNVEISFFHPQDQPADEKYANNLFYEGVAGEAGSDWAPSIISHLFEGSDGLSTWLQRLTLDASKTGTPAFFGAELYDPADVRRIEDVNDLYGTLMNKVEMMLAVRVGKEKLPPRFAPGLFKLMKMHHFVRIQNPDGETYTVLSAEEAIQQQVNGTWDGTGAELYVMSPAQVATLYGDPNGYGLTAKFPEARTILDAPIKWRGNLTKLITARLPHLLQVSEQGSVFESSLIRVNPMTQRSRAKVFQKPEFNRIRAMDQVQIARAQEAAALRRESKAFSRKSERNRVDTISANIMAHSNELARATHLDSRLLGLEISTFGSKSMEEGAALAALLGKTLQDRIQTGERSTAFEYHHVPPKSSSFERGLLIGMSSLTSPPSELREIGDYPVRGDLVNIVLDGFSKKAPDELLRVISHLTSQGVTVALTSRGTNTNVRDLREIAQTALREANFVLSGHGSLWSPPVWTDNQTQTMQAWLSEMAATSRMSSKNLRFVMWDDSLATEENTMYINDVTGEPYSDFQVRTGTAPVNAYKGFHTAKTEAEALQVQRALQALDADPEMQAHLFGESFKEEYFGEGNVELGKKSSDSRKADLKEKAQREFSTAIAHAAKNYVTVGKHIGMPAGVNGEFVRGAIVPLINSSTGEIVLTRLGHAPIVNDAALRAQLKNTPGTWAGPRLATFGVTTVDDQTTADGLVADWQTDSKSYLRAIIHTKLSDFSGKLGLIGSGFKTNGVRLSDTDMELPDFDVIPGMRVSALGNGYDARSKGVRSGIMTPANEIAFAIGMDTTQAFVKTFIDKSMTVDRWRGLDSKERLRLREKTRTALEAARRSSSIPLELTLELISELPTVSTLDGVGAVAELIQLAEVRSEIELPVTAESLATDLRQGADAETTIATAMLLWMMSDAARSPMEVMGSEGLQRGSRTEEVFSTKMPIGFTQIFDGAATGGVLDDWFNEQINSRLQRRVLPSGETVGMYMTPQREFIIKNRKGARDFSGVLQVTPIAPLGVDPVLTNETSARRTTADISGQELQIARETLGVETIAPGRGRLSQKLRDFISAKKAPNLASEQELETLLSGTTALGGATVKHGVPLLKTRKSREREALQAAFLKEMRMPLELTAENGWSDPNTVTEFERGVRTVLNTIGLDEVFSPWVHAWIRSYTASPKEKDAKTRGAEGIVTPKEAREALGRIMQNLKHGLLPTTGFPLSGHTSAEIRAFHNAVNSGRGSWDFKGDRSLDGFISEGLGILLDQNDVPRLRMAANGMFNTYRDFGLEYPGMATTLDPFEEYGLLAPSGDELRLTLSENDEMLLQDPLIADVYNATLLEQIEGSQALPIDSVGTRSNEAWAAKTKTPQINTITYKEQLNGAVRTFERSGSNTPGWLRVLLLLRAAQGMGNPILFGAAAGEQIRAGFIETGGTFFSGYGTGPMSAALDSTMQKLTGSNELARLSAEERKLMHTVAASLAKHPAFKELIREDTLPDYPLNNAGRVETFLHRLNKLFGKWQDPFWGSQSKAVAMRYLVGAIMANDNQQSRTNLTTTQLLHALGQNPRYLKDNNFIDQHAGGYKPLQALKMMRPSMLAQILNKVIGAGANSSNTGVSVATNLTVKIPLTFAGFGVNLATVLLGAQGANAGLALLMGGSWAGRVKAAVKREEYDPVRHDNDFIEETLEGIDLHNEFVKGSLTHWSLLGLGLLGQSLGLSGEDPEEKRRRRIAEMSGMGMYWAPRKIERDFRNKDMIYLSASDTPFQWLLGPLRELAAVGTVDPEAEDAEKAAMVQMHWSMKMFLSPMLGIERFLNNGDLSELTLGFAEALSSFPLINVQTWDDATRVAEELRLASEDSNATGNPEDLPQTFGFLMNTAMLYERMLFENAFLSEVYQAMDEYDRDSYKIPESAADQTIVYDKTAQPQKSSAYEEYMGEDGTALATRGASWNEAAVRRFAEQRPVFATIVSLSRGALPFSGNARSVMRTDQVIKERKIDKEELTSAEMQELVLSMWDPQNEREVLTLDGAAGVIRGMQMGTLRPGDPALENVFISLEDRKEIERIFKERIMVDSLNLGLDHEAAADRVEEYMYGSKTNPYAKSLFDVIYSVGDFAEAIPYQSSLTYRQLNTTYAMGPDGMPWAVGFGRAMIAPFQLATGEKDGSMPVDNRLNSVDLASNMNTGRRALEKMNDSWKNPTLEDLIEESKKDTEAIIDAIKDSAFAKGDANGWRYGGGGSGGSGMYRLSTPERNNVVYGASDPYVRPDDPNIRRATVRRERYSSQRGRLNQWQ